MIKEGYNEDLDELKEITVKGKNWISNLQTKERNATGIKNLKIVITRFLATTWK